MQPWFTVYFLDIGYPCFSQYSKSFSKLDFFIVVVVVVHTRPRAIPLAMITMRKSTHGFPFVFHMSMGLRLAPLRTAGAPLSDIHVMVRQDIP